MNGIARDVRYWAFFVAAVIAGCNRGPATVTVSGQVRFKDATLPGGTIQFFPESGHFVGAMIRPDGTFTVELPAGNYRVAIKETMQLPENWQHGDPIPESKPLLPTKYAGHQSSGLSAQIDDGIRSKTVDFQLK